MQPNNPAELQSLWSYLFLSRLCSLGLEHVVISPGSRSTPLVQAAESISRLNKHVFIDERSAAFTALGISKAYNNPAALICTSGTAVANYYPAVIEARQSGTPLLVLTADRPPEERGAGSNQTIDQIEIYGKYPVLFADAGKAEFSEEAFTRITSLATEAWQKSIADYGPVHINFPFDKPLESNREWMDTLSSIKITSQSLSEEKTSISLSETVKSQISESNNIVAIAGPMRPTSDLDSLKGIISEWNFPIIAEAGSQLSNLPNSITGSDIFLRDEKLRAELKPDLIIRIGRQPLGKGHLIFLADNRDVPHLVIPHNGYSDNAHFAKITILPENAYQALDMNISEVNENWIKKWNRVSELSKKAIYTWKSSALTDWDTYQELIPEIPEDWFVMSSNSFPARDLESASHLLKGQQIYLNRGASGIDGITSTAIGLGIGSDKNGVLFTGDLAFLHDITALLQTRKISTNLTIVVNNNRGGQIFRMLPFPELDDSFEKYFETPQSAHINHLAKAFGAGYVQVRQPGKLSAEFQKSKDRKGLHIIEMLTDPEASMKRRKAAWKFEFS